MPTCILERDLLRGLTPPPTLSPPPLLCLPHLVQVDALAPHLQHSRSVALLLQIYTFCLDSRSWVFLDVNQKQQRESFKLTNQVTCRGTFRDHFPVDQVPAATSLLLICPPRGSFNKLTLSPSLRLLRKLSSLTIANSGVSYSNICWMRAMIDFRGTEKFCTLVFVSFCQKTSGSQHWAEDSVGPFLPSKLEPHLEQHLPHR